MTELRKAANGSDDRSTPGYRLAASGRESAEDERLALLEHIFDPASRRRRALVQPGWRCLEVGAGRGSIAVWLAEQVGPSGHVVATDVDVRYLERLNLPNLEIRQHNILDDPIGGAGTFVRHGLVTVGVVLARRPARERYPAYGGVSASRRMVG